jgi:hypothetical protein
VTDKSARIVAQWTNNKSKVILTLRENNLNYIYDGYQCSGNLRRMASDELAIEYMEKIVDDMSKKRKIKINRAKTCAGKTL